MTKSRTRPNAKPTNETQRARTAGTKADRRRHEHEHRGHPRAERVHQRVRHAPTQSIGFVLVWKAGREGIQQAPRNGGGGEQHGDEQQSAAEKHRRKKPILKEADAVPQHRHEPEERDPREGNQVQCDANRILKGWVR